MFSIHHYLSSEINKAAHCWIVIWEGIPVGFASSLPLPSPYPSMKNAWREHRVVVLPEYQGLGIGVRVSEAVAQIHLQRGKRYFSKTSHPRLGGYREKSDNWKATSKNKMDRKDYVTSPSKKMSRELLDKHMDRVCYSHEYVNEDFTITVIPDTFGHDLFEFV